MSLRTLFFFLCVGVFLLFGVVNPTEAKLGCLKGACKTITKPIGHSSNHVVIQGSNDTTSSSSSTGTAAPAEDNPDENSDKAQENEASEVNEHPFLQFNGLINGSWFKFFIVAVASSRLALVFPKVGLPLITGYMIVGVLCGPYVLELVVKKDIPDLAYVTQTALAFIAFSAGSELYLPELRSLFKTIIYITGFNSLYTYIICTLVIYGLAAAGIIPWMNDYMGQCAFSMCLIAGSIMVARSPASAIAVVRELRAKGPVTSTMLGVTVVGDVVVLILFTLSNSFAVAMCAGGGIQGGDLVVAILTLFVAVGLGYGLGEFLIFLLWVPRWPGVIARGSIIPIGWFTFVVCDWWMQWTEHHWGIPLNFDALLICITAGYVVTNQSHNRVAFLHLLGGASPYIFIPFFTKVGVELNLPILYQSIGFAVIVFIVRAFCVFLGSATGGHFVGMDKFKKLTLWTTMLAQAGVSLGLASEVAVKFPGWGPKFQTMIISVVLINQFAGPVACKWALRRHGEAGKMADGEDMHGHGGGHGESSEDSKKPLTVSRSIIIGVDPIALSVASRLLKENWRVTLLDYKSSNLKLAKALKVKKSEISIAGNAHGHREDASGDITTSQGRRYSRVADSDVSLEVTDIGVTSSTAASSSTDGTIVMEQKADHIRLDLISVTKKPGSTHAENFHEALLDVDADSVESAIVDLGNDEDTYELCLWLLSAKRVHKVIARIYHPEWAPVFQQHGLLPILEHATLTQMLTQSVLSLGNLQFVSATLSLNEALAQIIHPVEDLQFMTLPMSGDQRLEWEESHPAPEGDAFTKLRQRLLGSSVPAIAGMQLLAVVPESLRGDYLDKMHSLHSHEAPSSDDKQHGETMMTVSGFAREEQLKKEAVITEKKEEEEFRKMQAEARQNNLNSPSSASMKTPLNDAPDSSSSS